MSTLQTSGAITLANIQSQYGGSNPISMSEYYKNGSYVTAPENDPGYSTSTRVTRTGSFSQSNGAVHFYWGGTHIMTKYATFVNAYGLDFQDGGDGYLYSVGTNYSSSNFTQHFYISRYRKANYNLPTSGQISIGDFYGAADD